MPFRRLLILAVLALAPAAVEGQFTTFIPPKRPERVPVKPPPVPVSERARAESLGRASVTNMKAWVDSAVGVVNTRKVEAPDPPPSKAATQPKGPARTSRPPASGTRAPDTASNLPLLALTGAISLVIGTLLLRPGKGRA